APLSRHVVLLLSRRAEARADRPRQDAQARKARYEERNDDDGADDDGPDYDGADDDSTDAIASSSQPGIRVGANVAASTHAWLVYPSAMRVPSSRAIAYS